MWISRPKAAVPSILFAGTVLLHSSGFSHSPILKQPDKPFWQEVGAAQIANIGQENGQIGLHGKLLFVIIKLYGVKPINVRKSTVTCQGIVSPVAWKTIHNIDHPYSRQNTDCGIMILFV